MAEEDLSFLPDKANTATASRPVEDLSFLPDKSESAEDFSFLPDQSKSASVGSLLRPMAERSSQLLSGLFRKGKDIAMAPFTKPAQAMSSMDEDISTAREDWGSRILQSKTLEKYPTTRGVAAALPELLVPTVSEAGVGAAASVTAGPVIGALGKFGVNAASKVSPKLGQFLARDVSTIPGLNKVFGKPKVAEPAVVQPEKADAPFAMTSKEISAVKPEVAQGMAKMESPVPLGGGDETSLLKSAKEFDVSEKVVSTMPPRKTSIGTEKLMKILDEAPVISRENRALSAAKEVGRGFRQPLKIFPEIADPVIRQFERRGNALEHYGVKLNRWAETMGKRGSKERRVAGLILDNFSQEDLISKGVDAVVPKELSALLNAAQKKSVQEMAVSFRTLGIAGGLEPENFLSSYLTRLRSDASRMGVKIDESAIAGVLDDGAKMTAEEVFGHYRIPKELYNKFFERRIGKKPYSLDAIDAFEAYLYPATRKAFMEPVLEKEVIPAYLRLRDGDMAKGIKPNKELAREAQIYINDVYGRNPNPNFSLDMLSRGLVGRYYESTLWGNPASALKNLSQIMNAGIEIGPKWVMSGMNQLRTAEGRKIFAESGIIFRPVELGAKTLKHGIGKIHEIGDFMTHAEYLLRGTTYLGERARQIAAGKAEAEASELARRMVWKTQFAVSGADLPRLFRSPAGRVAFQFQSFKVKQVELINSWVQNKEWGKISAFAGISYLMGGPESVVPWYDNIKEKLPKDVQAKVDAFTDNTNVSGLVGVDLSSFFGLGLINDLLPNPPAVSVGKKVLKLGKDVHEGKVRTGREATGPLLDIASMHVKGGVIAKKLVESASSLFSGVRKGARDRTIAKVEPKDIAKRLLLGQPTEQVRQREEVAETALLKTRMQNERNRLVDMYVEAAMMDRGKDAPSEKSMALRKQAYKRLLDWNKDNPKIMLDVKDVLNEARAKEMTSRERQMKSAPKSLRFFEAARKRSK